MSSSLSVQVFHLGIFKILAVGWELSPKFQLFFICGKFHYPLTESVQLTPVEYLRKPAEV